MNLQTLPAYFTVHHQDTVNKILKPGDVVVVVTSHSLTCCYQCWKLFCLGEEFNDILTTIDAFKEVLCTGCFRKYGSKIGELCIVIDVLTNPKEFHESWWPRVLIEIDGALFAVERVRVLE